MYLRMFLAILCFTVACAKKDEAPPQSTSAPRIASIPDENCQPFLQPGGDFWFGAHEFGPGEVHLAAPFYCGIREGKRCYYYLQLNTQLTELPMEDVRCE